MPGRPVRDRLEVLVLEGEEVRRLRPEGPLILGRDPEADVPVRDPRVSRAHCRMELGERGLKITDLGSSNGTFVDGQEISQVVLPEGGTARIGGGGVEVRVVSRAPADPAHPSTAASAADTPRDPLPRRRRAPRPAAPAPEAAAPPPARAPAAGGRVRRTRGGRGAGVAVVIVVAGLALAGIAWLLSGDSDEELRARELRTELARLQEARELEGALRLAAELEREFPDLPAGREAAELQPALREALGHREAAERAFAALLASDPPLPGGELLERVRRLGRKHEEVLPPEAIAGFEERARGEADARSRRIVERARIDVEASLQAGYHGPALRRIAEAEGSPFLFGASRQALADLRRRATVGARAAFDTLVKELEGAPAARVRMRLAGALERFAGTPHEPELRARLQLADAKPRVREPAVAAEPAPEPERPAATPDEDPLEVLTRAEALIARRRYGEAVPLLARAAELTEGPRRAAVLARRARVEGFARVLDATLAEMREHPRRFSGLPVGGGLEGRLLEADRERIVLSLGPGAKAIWPWERLTPERLAVVVQSARLLGAVRVDAAELLLELGLRERALEALRPAYEMEPRERRRIQGLVAEARGMAEPPDGGFELVQGRFVTPEEKRELLLAQRIERLVEGVSGAEPGAWAGAAAELRDLGARGTEALRRGLEARLERARAALEGVGPLRRANLARTRAQLHGILEDRRKKALELIFDSKRYPYPYGPGQKEVQAEVDRLVAAVREVWETPARMLLAQDPRSRALVEDARAVSKELAELGSEASVEGLLAELDARVDMRHYGGDAGARKLLEHYQQVAAWNASREAAIGAGERRVHELTNAYRVMMGRRAVMIDDRLVLAARGHSQEMQDLGYFAHKSPTTGRTSPSDRARLAGWSGSVSENIARGNGDPARVLDQWLHSSGHHRNVLGARHTHLGVGCADGGRFWTQNFGRGSTKPPKKPSVGR